MNTEKNSTLELIKLFASYMVVFIHVLFPGRLGIAADAVARFAVPFFFLVSGFYSYEITCEKIQKRIRSIFTLFVLATVCYNLFKIATLLYWNTNGLAALLDDYTLSTFIELIVLNATVSSGHLWYLLAILYVYIIFYFATKFRVKDKVIFLISPILLVLHIFLGEGLSVFGIKLPIAVVRNFALMGIPFFALGLFVKKHEHKLQAISNYVIAAAVILGAAETVLSRWFFGENELYIGSLLILFAIICTFIKYKDAKHPSFLVALEGCSTYIYIFHMIISSVLYIAYGVLGIDISASVILASLHPLAVCVCSTIFAYIFIKLLKKLRSA